MGATVNSMVAVYLLEWRAHHTTSFANNMEFLDASTCAPEDLNVSGGSAAVPSSYAGCGSSVLVLAWTEESCFAELLPGLPACCGGSASGA